MTQNDVNIEKIESCENGKNETDKVDNLETDKTQEPSEEIPSPSISLPEDEKDAKESPAAIFVPKYKYGEGMSKYIV